MKRIGLGAVLLAAAAAAAATAALASSAHAGVKAIRFSRDVASVSTDTSSNWSGYAMTGPGSSSTTASPGTTFTDVTATWTVPTAICTPGSSASSAMWVGLGGYSESSQELEQTGTDADCTASGQPSYYAWYELVPANSVNVSLKVKAGDKITAVVLIKNTDVLVQIHDLTRGTRFTKNLPMTSPDLTSAEVIAEAPSECDTRGNCSELSLTNFGSVNFTKVDATASTPATGIEGGHVLSPFWQYTPIQLIPAARRSFGYYGNQPAGSAGADPANLATDGSSFTVNWVANATSS